MEFYKVLNDILDKYGLKAADLHKRTSLKRPYISKMLNGDLVPSSYDAVDAIIQAFDLELEDRIALTDSYLMTRTTGDSNIMDAAFRKMYTLKYPESADAKDLCSGTPENGKIISGGELISAIRELVKNSKGSVDLFFVPLTSEPADRLCRAFGAMSESTVLNWFLPFYPDKREAVQNFSIFVNCLPVMALKSCSLKKIGCDIRTMIKNSVFPFWIMNGKQLVLFDKEMQNGQFFDDESIIALYAEKLGSVCSKALQPFIISLEKAEDILICLGSWFRQSITECYDYYSFSKVPCIVFDIDKQDVENYTVEETDDHEIAGMYVDFLRSTLMSSSRFIDIFSQDGLREYLDKEEWYEAGKHYSKSFPKKLRRLGVKSMVENCSNVNGSEILGLRIPGFDKTSYIGLNILSTGQLILLYDFDKKSAVIMANDRTLTDSLIAYINELRKYKLIGSSEESLECVKAELAKRNI